VAKTQAFKKFFVGGEWDRVFLLPQPAFKLWMFYYRLEGAKREGWATRKTISEKCDIDKDTVTYWRNWLVENGWMRKIRDHVTPNNPLAMTPIMCVRQGTIPVTKDRRGKSSGSKTTQFKRGRKVSVTAETESTRHRAVTGDFRRRGDGVSSNRGDGVSSDAVQETFRHNVDNYDVDQPDVEKTSVDGQKRSVSKPDRESLPEGVERDADGVLTMRSVR